MNLHIQQSDPTQSPGKQLIDALSAELGALYNNDDGSNAFTPELVNQPHTGFFIAWLDDTPVACGALITTEIEDIAEVKRVYVIPSARGKGISRKIMHYLEKRARDYGYTHLRLETGTRQPAAIALYESSGYTRINCYGAYNVDPLSRCYEKSL